MFSLVTVTIVKFVRRYVRSDIKINGKNVSTQEDNMLTTLVLKSQDIFVTR